MRPKEIQKKLGITADRIKFYKREELFFPENPPSGNKGTDYTEADYESLKLLEVLTKSGLTCGDIKKMQDGDMTLEEAALLRMASIEAEMKRKQNALLMLSSLISDKAEFETFDTEFYWEIISQKEEAGEEFINVEDMYGYRTISLVRKIKCPHCGGVVEVDLEDFVYDESSDERENGMGPDCVYNFDSEEFLECFECGKKLHVDGWIREYPIGAFDSEIINVEEREDQ